MKIANLHVNLRKAIAVSLLAMAAVTARAQVATVNAAGFRAGFPVAPGSLVSAFGTFAGAVSEDGSC